MAIVKMKQFTLLAFHEHREQLLKELQRFGEVHFRNLQQADLEEMDYLKQDFSPDLAAKYEAELDKITFALNKLTPFAPKAKLTDARTALDYEAFDDCLAGSNYQSVYDKVKAADDRISAIRSEISRLQTENDGLKTWEELDVSPAELDKLERAKAIVGTVNRMTVDALTASLEEQFDCLYLETLGTVKDDTALFLLLPAGQYDDVLNALKDAGFTRATLGFREVPAALMESNEQKITGLEAERELAVESIRALGGECAGLQIVSDYYSTVLERERTRANFMALDSVLLMEGWVPADEEDSLNEILSRVCGDACYLETREVEHDSEDVPIKLKNNKFVSAFTDITEMYSMPKYNELDPTPVLTPFYWLFFGLMVGDAGYGLLVMIGTALALKFLDLKDGMKNFMKFFFLLSFSIILGGVLYGSMFGVTFFAPINTPEGYKPILSSMVYGENGQPDIVLMLVLSVALGVIHIIVGLLTKGYENIRDGHYLAALFDSGLWITTLLSAISLLLGAAGIVGDTGVKVSWGVFIVSLVGLALTQGRESPSLGGKIGGGLYGVYGLSSYVGDLVSYTRIVALALSGAYIAYAFNLMAGQLPAGILRIVLGGIIIVLGQALNLGLALLGAYVHTCRLQYVEFFGKFYEGGGVPFAPLKIKNDYIRIK